MPPKRKDASAASDVPWKSPGYPVVTTFLGGYPSAKQAIEVGYPLRGAAPSPVEVCWSDRCGLHHTHAALLRACAHVDPSCPSSPFAIVQFYQKAFGTKVIMSFENGKVVQHAELSIGEGRIMVGEGQYAEKELRNSDTPYKSVALY